MNGSQGCTESLRRTVDSARPRRDGASEASFMILFSPIFHGMFRKIQLINSPTKNEGDRPTNHYDLNSTKRSKLSPSESSESGILLARRCVHLLGPGAPNDLMSEYEARLGRPEAGSKYAKMRCRSPGVKRSMLSLAVIHSSPC